MALLYQGNRKHKEPWQPGRKGTLCPPDISLARAQELLAGSVAYGRQRYAVERGLAFCAQYDNQRHWHGYPIGWKHVPATVVKELLARGAVTPRDVKKYWEIDP